MKKCPIPLVLILFVVAINISCQPSQPESKPSSDPSGSKNLNGELRITASPEDAILYVDDKQVALLSTDPLLLKLAPGPHSIRVARVAHHDLEGSVDIRSGHTLPVNAILKPLWEFRRDPPVSRQLHVGQRRRLSLTAGQLAKAIDEYQVIDRPGRQIILSWGSIRFHIGVRVLENDKVVASSDPKQRRGLIDLTLPQSGQLTVQVFTDDQSDAPHLGLIRFELGVYENACPRVAKGRSAPRVSPLSR